MAIIEMGILGPFRGKVGNVIGYERNGVACVRSMPTHYHDRKSAAQLKNRNRFTMVMKAMSAVREATTLGFRRFANGMTEMNVATRENYYRLVKEVGTKLEYAYDGLVLSRGATERLGGAMMSLSGRNLSLVWNGRDTLGGGEDEVNVMVVNAERMKMKMWRGVAQRKDGQLTVALPSGWEKEETYGYVAMERGGEWSDSEYEGRIGNGMMAIVAEGGEQTADSEFDTNNKRSIAISDQSAIKVLSEMGENRGKKEAETPPGEEI